MDSAADVGTLPLSVYKKMQKVNMESLPPDCQVTAYGGSRINYLGNEVAMGLFLVVDGDKEPLLGRDACVDLKLIKKVDAIEQVNMEPSSKTEFIKNNKDLFEGKGRFVKDFNIELKEGAKGLSTGSEKSFRYLYQYYCCLTNSKQSSEKIILNKLANMPLIAELANEGEVSDSSKTFVFENEGHTLGNVLKSIIGRYPEVDFCGYTVPHPAESTMHLRIQVSKKSRVSDDSSQNIKAIDILVRGLKDVVAVCDHTEMKFDDAIQLFEKSPKPSV
ncbi:putative DNA-directed RNA polymerases I and III subunit RPAC2 [Pseudolycoriella hygida]|uniref:DNA-directed RNA polymerase I subunit D n=1 Tax=Pseudolycoriella hygida TaxID=35572 RepID=A0A9Q0MZP2_9DIPT|nr:putative DNA-directed RNA polymerases I and III subunit RPAC2 [Pseudolycoriella hygida]